MVRELLNKEFVRGSHVARPETPAYTPACLAWHVLFSLSRSEEWQFKGCQFLTARYCAACMTSWVPSMQLRRPVFQHKYVTNVGGGKINTEASRREWRSAVDPIKRSSELEYTSEGCLNFSSSVPLHLLKLIWGVSWDTLSGTSCWNVNNKAVHF